MIRDPGDHHHLHLFEDHRWAVAGAAILYVLAGALFLIMALDDSLLQPVDDWWRERMVAGEGSWITLLAKVLDVLGRARPGESPTGDYEVVVNVSDSPFQTTAPLRLCAVHGDPQLASRRGMRPQL